MPDYRRNRIPGATYFFTVNFEDRRSDMLVAHIDVLREAVRQAAARWRQRDGGMRCAFPPYDCAQ